MHYSELSIVSVCPLQRSAALGHRCNIQFLHASKYPCGAVSGRPALKWGSGAYSSNRGHRTNHQTQGTTRPWRPLPPGPTDPAAHSLAISWSGGHHIGRNRDAFPSRSLDKTRRHDVNANATVLFITYDRFSVFLRRGFAAARQRRSHCHGCLKRNSERNFETVWRSDREDSVVRILRRL